MSKPQMIPPKATALVVEGGAMRGIFSTGVLDAFLLNQFNPFDACWGVSAGATNIAAYLAGMYQRNYKVYTDYSLRPEFISWTKFIRGGHLIDLDWLWNVTIQELELDVSKIIHEKRKFWVGVTELNTGSATYLNPDQYNLAELLKASSSIPVIYRKQVLLDGQHYVDGGLADPIPVQKAASSGATRIMVIRSRPANYEMPFQPPSPLFRFYLKDFPGLIQAAIERPQKYSKAVEFIRNPPPGTEIIEINPPENFKTGRLTKDIQTLQADYLKGVQAGYEAIEKWHNNTNSSINP